MLTVFWCDGLVEACFLWQADINRYLLGESHEICQNDFQAVFHHKNQKKQKKKRIMYFA